MKQTFITLLTLLIFVSCTSEDVNTDNESGVSTFWMSKWKRIDYANGTYLDLSGDTPMFCSQSDWSKFIFSSVTQVNSSSIKFTITNPETNAYVTVGFSKVSDDEIEGTVLDSNMPEWSAGVSYGLYEKTTEWCSTNPPQSNRYMYVVDYPYSGARTLPLNLYRYPYTSSSHSYGQITKMFRYGTTMPSYGQEGTLTVTEEIDNYDGYYVLRDQTGKYVGGLFDIGFPIYTNAFVVKHDSSQK